MSLFLFSLTLLLIHELDAIRCKEWRMLPGLSVFNDKIGANLFVILHIPLVFWFLAALTEFGPSSIVTFRYVVDVFVLIHFGLHVLMLNHPKNEFTGVLSWSLIIGAGLAGGLDLILI